VIETGKKTIATSIHRNKRIIGKSLQLKGDLILTKFLEMEFDNLMILKKEVILKLKVKKEKKNLKQKNVDDKIPAALFVYSFFVI
jgi:hypothetical protein